MEEVKVSIIMPSYKRHQDLFSRAIESLLNQTYKNIEIVVVDDNAKPEHKEYREELLNYINSLNSDKILYIQNTNNLGGALSRNEGIKNATGEYITFLDDDDEYLEEKVEKQLAYMLKNNLDAIFGDLKIYNENNELIDYRKRDDIKRFDNDYLLKYHLTKQIAGTPTYMVKKQVLLDIGGFDDVKTGQEWFLMLKIINADVKLGYTPWCDIKAYRTKAEAISTGKNKIVGEEYLYKYRKQYFDKLSCWDRSYIRCRHYAVMAVAYKRNSMYGKMVVALMQSVLSNPLFVISEGYKYFKKVLFRR